MFVTCSNLGTVGWFGNHFYRYLTLIYLSEEHNQPIQTSEWLGEQVFNLPCQRPNKRLTYKTVNETGDKHSKDLYKPAHSKVLALKDFENNNYDVLTHNNAFYHTSYIRKYKDTILKKLELSDNIKTKLIPQIYEFLDLQEGEEFVVIHARVKLGRYYNKWRFPYDWYKQKLNELLAEKGDRIKKIFLCSDDFNLVQENLSEFNLININDHIKHDLKPCETAKEIAKPGALGGTGCFTFVPDFVIMTLCDELLTSDSTFSYAAAMLNRKENARFYKSSIEHNRLVQYDPWNSHILNFRTHQWGI